MTELLRQAIAKLQTLSKNEQNAIASLILEELEDEQRWDDSFSRSPDVLAKLAASAMAEYHAGETQELDLNRSPQADMTSKPQPKSTARLEARISPETKALLQKAADLEGRSLTDFVVSSVQAEAHRVIQKHQMLKLNVEDSKAFVDAILNPPKPNNALQSAALRY